jgi:diacylglycerol kinase family enzyme
MPDAPPDLPSRTTPFFIVMNARSGSGDAEDIRQKMQTVLSNAGQAHEFVLVERPEDIGAQAHRAVDAARSVSSPMPNTSAISLSPR